MRVNKPLHRIHRHGCRTTTNSTVKPSSPIGSPVTSSRYNFESIMSNRNSRVVSELSGRFGGLNLNTTADVSLMELNNNSIEFGTSICVFDA